MNCFPVRARRTLGAISLGAAALLAGCAQLTDLLTPPAADLAVTPEVAAALAAIDPTYVIGPEDALDITVWRDETLKAAVLVRPDGGVSFPLVGDLTVAGKTAIQVRDELTERLDKFLPEPVVTVAVTRVASQRIYVLGRVNKPGDYPVGRSIDVLQALTLAGGLTPFAVEDGIRVIRRVNGKSVAIPFQYSRVRRGSDLSQNITLRSGDLLLVP
ncbi:MAG: polysaccharide biosynthesis/export family protein [Leptothrix sp. (in: b-proteobacteria)]